MKKDENLIQALHEAKEVGCNGLVGGWAVQKATGKRVHAFDVRKPDGPFYCEGCLGEAIHHFCTADIRDHFAHIAQLTPIAGSKESELHLQCKTEVFQALRVKFPAPADGSWKWVCDDICIKENKTRKLAALRPDIGGRINGKRIAIEVQSSALTVPRILRRCHGYSQRNISILWVVPLCDDIGEKPFRPRHFERYLHSIYYGRVYYWRAGFGSCLLPVHFGIAWTHVEHREWYEEGELREAGGYNKPYKRIRTPLLRALVPIESGFNHHKRAEHRPWNERRSVPQ